MKPHLVGAILVCALCCASQSLRAQGPPGDRPVLVGFLIGGEATTGAFSNEPGGTVGIAVQLPLSPRRLAVRGDVSNHFMLPSDCVTVFSPAGGSYRDCGNYPWKDFFSLSGDIVARLNDPATRWSPYVLGGAALYAGSDHGSTEPNKSGLQWGGGFEVRPATRSILFVEWRHLAMGVGGVSSVVMGARF